MKIMNRKKKLVFLYLFILISAIGIFTLQNALKKDKKIILTSQEKSWIEENKGKTIPFLIPEWESLYFYKTYEDKFQGVYHDYATWLENKYGLTFEIVQKSNGSFAEDVDSGNTLITYNALKNYSRDLNYKYFNLKAKTSIILVEKFEKKIIDGEKRRKKLGMVRNTTETKDYFLTYPFTQYEKILLSSYEEGLEKLKNGDIDLFLAKSRELMYADLEMSVVEKLSDAHYSLAINRKNPELSNIIEKTLPFFEEKIFPESYFKHRGIYSTQMLKNNQTLKKVKKKYPKIVVEVPDGKDFLPLYYIEKGKPIGYLPTLLDNLSSSIGVPIEIASYSSPEKKHIRALDPSRKNSLSIPYYNSEVSVVGKRGARYIKTLDDLREKKVGVVLNQYTQDIPLRTNINFIPFENLEIALNALNNDNIEYVIGDFIFLDSKIENMHLADDIKVVGFLENSNQSLSFSFNEEDRILYTLFLQILPKDVSEYTALKDLLISPKVIKLNYYYLASTIFIFSIIIGIILFFLRSNINHKNKAEKLNRAMISSLEMASSFNDNDTGHHIVRVSKYSELLAKELKLPSSLVKDITYYASLHDIGKIGIPDSILKKPGKLDLEETTKMREHVNIGHKFVKNAGLGKTAENIVRFHHERWDGKGYPLGFSGSKIPIEARIVSLTDVYDALRQKRPYKTSFTHEEAIQIIVSDSGIFFDPHIVKLFLKLNEEFDEIFNKY